MFCSQCGNAIGAEPYCKNCGAPTGVAGVVFPASRVARHLHTLGILWTVFAVYLALGWLLVLPFLHMFVGGHRWMGGSDRWMYAPFHPGGWVLHLIAVVVLARAILSLAVGVALLTRQPWGRMFAIVIAILTLLKPLLGTLLGIYTLWVMFSPNADLEYAQLTAPGALPSVPGPPV